MYLLLAVAVDCYPELSSHPQDGLAHYTTLTDKIFD